MPLAARSMAQVCDRSLDEIVDSSPADDMGVFLLGVLCVYRQRSLRRANHSSRAVLPSDVCLGFIAKS